MCAGYWEVTLGYSSNNTAKKKSNHHLHVGKKYCNVSNKGDFQMCKNNLTLVF